MALEFPGWSEMSDRAMTLSAKPSMRMANGCIGTKHLNRVCIFKRKRGRGSADNTEVSASRYSIIGPGRELSRGLSRRRDIIYFKVRYEIC
jgi:hypothetical protein